MAGNRAHLAGAVFAGALALGGADARAQSSLRGTFGEDPIQRVGATSGEATRNAPRAARRAPAEVAARPPRTAASEPELATPEAEPAIELAPESVAARPRQQNFRSLERPPNTAVRPGAPGELLPSQGLPPVLPPRRARSTDADPYAPLGLRLGGFTANPTLDVQTGYDSNPERRDSTLRKRGSTFIRTEAGLALRSDFARHEVNADIRAGYSRFFSTPDANRPDADARLRLRLDAAKDTAIDAELRGRLDSQTPGGANLTATATGRPLTYQTGASLGITQRFNRLAVSARTTVDRADFEDAKLTNGQTLSQKDRNFTQYGLRLRAGYEVTPGLVPFAEVVADTRRYDENRDSSGFRRSSNGLQLRLGSTFEITRTLTGEVVGGYGLRTFNDQRLRDLRGPIVEAGLAWSVSPLTTVRVRAGTEFEETTIANASGAISRRIGAEISHAFLRNLAVTAGITYSRADFTGIARQDTAVRGTVALDYALNRNMSFRLSYANERTTSNTPGNNVSANVWLFGARLQF